MMTIVLCFLFSWWKNSRGERDNKSDTGTQPTEQTLVLSHFLREDIIIVIIIITSTNPRESTRERILHEIQVTSTQQHQCPYKKRRPREKVGLRVLSLSPAHTRTTRVKAEAELKAQLKKSKGESEQEEERTKWKSLYHHNKPSILFGRICSSAAACKLSYLYVH